MGTPRSLSTRKMIEAIDEGTHDREELLAIGMRWVEPGHAIRVRNRQVKSLARQRGQVDEDGEPIITRSISYQRQREIGAREVARGALDRMVQCGTLVRIGDDYRRPLAEAPPTPTPADAPDDDAELVRLEGVIREGSRAFVAVGNAYREIRDRKLWRSTPHATFETYCAATFGVTRRQVNRLIDATAIAQTVVYSGPMGPVYAPINERQCRALARVPPDERADVWRRAVDAAGGQPTAEQIADVVDPGSTALRVPDLAGTVDRLLDYYDAAAIITEVRRRERPHLSAVPG